MGAGTMCQYLGYGSWRVMSMSNNDNGYGYRFRFSNNFSNGYVIVYRTIKKKYLLY